MGQFKGQIEKLAATDYMVSSVFEYARHQNESYEDILEMLVLNLSTLRHSAEKSLLEYMQYSPQPRTIMMDSETKELLKNLSERE